MRPYKEKQKRKQKRKGRLDIPWKRLTERTRDENKRFYGLDSFFNAMVNEFKHRLEQNPIVPNGFTFLIIYRININGMAEVEIFQYLPETEEQRTIDAIQEVITRQLRVSATKPRSSTTFQTVVVNLLAVGGVETLVFQGSSYEGDNRLKAFDVIRDEDFKILNLRETKRMEKFSVNQSYLDPELQDETERRKSEMLSP